METKEIGAIVDSIHDDELDVLSQLLTLSGLERSDAMILRENGRPFRPGCGCAMSRNGTDIDFYVPDSKRANATDLGERLKSINCL